MMDILIKRVSVTYKCYEMYAHRGKKVYYMCLYVCDGIGLRKYMRSTVLYPIKYSNLNLNE
jgi:hypothetical protein